MLCIHRTTSCHRRSKHSKLAMTAAVAIEAGKLFQWQLTETRNLTTSPQLRQGTHTLRMAQKKLHTGVEGGWVPNGLHTVLPTPPPKHVRQGSNLKPTTNSSCDHLKDTDDTPIYCAGPAGAPASPAKRAASRILSMGAVNLFIRMLPVMGLSGAAVWGLWSITAQSLQQPTTQQHHVRSPACRHAQPVLHEARPHEALQCRQLPTAQHTHTATVSSPTHLVGTLALERWNFLDSSSSLSLSTWEANSTSISFSSCSAKHQHNSSVSRASQRRAGARAGAATGAPTPAQHTPHQCGASGHAS